MAIPVRIQKSLLVVSSLAVSVLLIEILLEAGGVIYREKMVSNRRIAEKCGKMTRVLCLGDSFTFGEGAPAGNSYPAQLQQMLDAVLPGKFVVYNAGIPGQNSSQVLKRLPSNIGKYNPGIVILLIGSNNRTVLEDSNYLLFRKQEGDRWGVFLFKLDAAFNRSHIYKLAKAAVLNLRHKFRLAIKSRKRNIKKKSGDAGGPDTLFKLGENYYDKAREGMDGPDDRAAINKEYFDRAEAVFKELLKYSSDKDFSTRAKAHYFLSKVYFAQGRNELAIKNIDEALRYHSDAADLRQFKKVISESLLSREENKNFDDLLRHDLSGIISLCRKYNIKIIILNYPSTGLYDIWEDIAKKSEVGFIDIKSRFNAALQGGNYRDLFSKDLWHPNANGYKIMAEATFEFLTGIAGKNNYF